MAIWDIYYFPPEGVRNAPEDIILELCNSKERAQLKLRFEVLAELQTKDWPHWVKMVGGMYQITSGDFRLYFNISGRTLIVCHVCRKVRQKAKVQDIGIAQQNWRDYRKG